MRPWIESKRSGFLVRWRDFHGQKQSSALLPDEIQARRWAQVISLNLSQQYSLEASLVKSTTVADMVDLWRLTVPVPKETTRECYRIVLQNFVRHLGPRNLEGIRPLDIARYLRDRIQQVAPYTYSAEVQYVRRLFRFAHANNMIAVDPAQDFHAPTPTSNKHACLSWVHEVELLSVLEKLNPKFLPRILLCRDTGMRMANAHRLIRKDICFAPPSVTFIALKSQIRLTLPLTRRLTLALRQFQSSADESFIFPYKAIREERNYTGASVFLLWLNKKLSFRFDFHDLRYSFRKRFGDATHNLELAEYCLGHSLKTRIQSFYFSPPSPEELAEQFQVFDDAQETALAGVRSTQVTDAEIWQELKGNSEF